MPTKISKYVRPAGGWDALLSSFRHLREQGVLAKGAATMLKANQPEGFDCPGCAWPDRNPHASFEFCENGVKAVAAESTQRRVTREFFAANCLGSLAKQDDYFLEAQGRLTEPMRYDANSDCYLPISWPDAFELIAGHLNALAQPDQALFYTSGRTSNEAAFLYQLFAREFGTNNLPDCSNLCHEASGVAMIEQLGVGKGTVTLDDFTKAEAIFIFGQNPGSNHPRMLGELRDAARRGCRIVAFNPLRERGLERFAHPQSAADMLTGGSTPIASHYYTPRIGGDLAAVKGMAKAVLESGDVDVSFIANHCHGYPGFRDDLVAELRASGTAVEVVSKVYHSSHEGTATLVDAALARLGRLDAACLITGQIVIGPFLESSPDDWERVKRANLDGVYHGLRAVLPPMVKAGTGQVVVFTSAAGARPEPRVSLYGSTRAGANALVRAVGLEYARSGVTVNAIGTNFMDFPGFIKANRAEDPEGRKRVEQQVPMRRLGTMEELAEFTVVLLDGRTRFQTGQFFSYSGGWST